MIVGKGQSKVVTFIDEAVRHIWMVVGWLCCLTAALIFIIGSAYGTIDFSYMLPLCLIYVSIASLITGLVLKDRWITFLPFIGVVIALFILLSRSLDPTAKLYWNLLFSLSFIPVMVIPGHILNHKAKAIC